MRMVLDCPAKPAGSRIDDGKDARPAGSGRRTMGRHGIGLCCVRPHGASGRHRLPAQQAAPARTGRRLGPFATPARGSSAALHAHRDAHATADAERGEAFLRLRFSISCSSVTRTRAPDAPIGCPSAMAPPLTLTLPVSQPRSLLTAQACAANASLASTSSRSSIFQPAFLSAAREAGIGPVPMIAGSTPACAQETMRASTLRFSLAASPALHQHDRGGPIIDAGGIAGGDGAILREGRPQLADRRRAWCRAWDIRRHRRRCRPCGP